MFEQEVYDGDLCRPYFCSVNLCTKQVYTFVSVLCVISYFTTSAIPYHPNIQDKMN